MISIPTGQDIYLEVEGKKIAVVQSCLTKTIRSIKNIDEFGSEMPAATVGGKQNHLLELTKVVPLRDASVGEDDFYALSDFTVMIVKPDRRIVYAGCEWSSIGESISLSAPCIEKIEVIAAKRMVI